VKFPRSNKPFTGQLDAAPFAAVFFLLLMFVGLTGNLVFTPGVPIQLPAAVEMAGTPNPTVEVVVDKAGQLYFDYQITTEAALRRRLAQKVRQSKEPLTLVIEADREVSYDVLVRLGLLAREAGIKDALLATRPPQGKANPPDQTP
jgi:biopolymer transport protein ExbD